MSNYEPLKLSNFHAKEGFFHHYQDLVTTTVLPYQYKILNDEIEGITKSHAIENFRLAAKVRKGEPITDGFYGMVFQDSDVAKWLEAVAYSLVNFPDKDLEALADSVIAVIEEAQEEDGYLNTYFTIKDHEKRFTNLQEAHELYCAGHMMEAAYNTVLAGMQLDGKRFFYVNPLEVIPGISGEAITHRHVLAQRPEWYACACCPPNVARLLSSIGSYAYAEDGSTLYCHLYIAGEITTSFGLSLDCITDYPKNGKIQYRIKTSGTYTLALRIPDWSTHTRITLNNSSLSVENLTTEGYFKLTHAFHVGDEITLELDLRIQKIYANSKVSHTNGMVAIQRGPLVYCVEGIDNEGEILSYKIKRDATLKAMPYDDTLLGGIVPILVDGVRTKSSPSLYSYQKPEETPCQLMAIPYYTWGNRVLTQMRVWLPEQ